MTYCYPHFGSLFFLMSKQPNKAVKPTAAAGPNTRASSRIGLHPASPANRATSQEPPAPTSVPRTIDASRKFLHGQGYLSKSSDPITVDVLNNQLAIVLGRTDLPPIVVAQLWSVKLLLPNAMKLASDHTKALIALNEQVEVLAERIAPPGEPSDYSEQFSSIEEKLVSLHESVNVALSNAGAAENAALEVSSQLRTMREEVWETPPPQPRARGPSPSPDFPPLPDNLHPNAPRRKPAPSNQRPPSAKDQAATEKHLHSQGCSILVEPTTGLLFDAPKPLTAREWVTKADLAWATAYPALVRSGYAREIGIEVQPRIVFRTAVRLPRGGIRFEMGDRSQAALLSNARVAKAFEQGFGDVSCRGQGATVLLQCAPIDWCPEEPEAVRALERDNQLSVGDIMTATWVKPPNKRGPNQLKVVVRLELRSQELADRLITEGGRLDCSEVVFRKPRQEPTRCLKCQRYGHKAVKCKKSVDSCSQCGGNHRSAACDMRDLKYCVSCDSDTHCSYERSCPVFRAECERFNQRRPENRSRFYNTAKDADSHSMPSRPIHHPASATLADAMPLTGIRRPAPAPPPFLNTRTSWNQRDKEPTRKERDPSAEWDQPGLITTPRAVPLANQLSPAVVPGQSVVGTPVATPTSSPPQSRPSTPVANDALVHPTVESARYSPSVPGPSTVELLHIQTPRGPAADLL